MKLRELEIPTPVLPAPLSGYTDRPYREILRQFGAPITYTEMIPAEGLVRNPSAVLKELNISDEPRPIGVQIFGRDPHIMATAAEILQSLSASLIDINLGCSVKKIVNNGCGAALLREPERVVKICKAIREKIQIPLTVKLRSGWSQDSINCVELAKALEDVGVDAICLHPRTKEQLFSGKADWSLIARLKENVSVPVIGNGDIKTPADAHRMISQTNCDAVMIGRAIIGNPWFIRQTISFLNASQQAESTPNIEQPSLKERLEVILKHYQLSVYWKGEPKGVVEMRKHFVKYVRGFPVARSLRNQVMSFTTLAEIQNWLEEIKNTLCRDDNEP